MHFKCIKNFLKGGYLDAFDNSRFPEDLRFSFPFQRFGAVVLQGKPLNWFDTCSCLRRRVTKDVWRSTWNDGTNRNYRCSKKDSFQSFCFTFPTIQEQMNPGNIIVHTNHFHWFPRGMQLNQFKTKDEPLLTLNLKLFLRCRNEFFFHKYQLELEFR